MNNRQRIDELLAEAGMTRAEVEAGATVQQLIWRLEGAREQAKRLDGDGYPMGYPSPASNR
jgi:hypothetical protein